MSLAILGAIGSLGFACYEGKPPCVLGSQLNTDKLTFSADMGEDNSLKHQRIAIGADWNQKVYEAKNWEIVGGGLPTGQLGKIGIDIHRSNPDVMYSVIQNLNPDPDYVADTRTGFDEFTDHSYDALIGGEVYKSTNGGKTWKNISPEGIDVSGKAAYSFNMIYADALDPDIAYIIGGKFRRAKFR